MTLFSAEAGRHTIDPSSELALLRASLDHISDGVAIFNAGSHLVVTNDAFGMILGVSLEERAPGTARDEILRLIAERRHITQDDAIRLAQASRGGTLCDLKSIRPDGTMLHFRSIPVADGGRLDRVTDITAGMRAESAEQAARDAEEATTRAKSDFLANMSHELRTPLNAIIGFAEMMTNEIFGPLDKRYAEYVRIIIQSGRHLLDLINDVLDLSKIEAGRMSLDLHPVDIASLAELCVSMMMPRAVQAKCRIDVEMAPGLPRVLCDERRIKQVLLNLLANAIAFIGGPNGRIGITASTTADGMVVLAVTDTGIGIAPEHISRVLQEWGQAPSEHRPEQEGTGLGLPLSKRLMELHEGSLQLTSEIGIGTTVTLTFPSKLVVPPAPLGPTDQ
jgi:signal transduction histidine kinase